MERLAGICGSLDLTIAKPADNSRRLQYWPYFKATSLGVPLGTRSAHPFSLHRSWPRAYCFRLAAHSSSRKHYMKARATFIGRLKQSFFEESIIKELQDLNAWSVLRRRNLLPRPPRPPRTGEGILWLVVPAQTLWVRSGLTKVTADFLKEPFAVAL